MNPGCFLGLKLRPQLFLVFLCLFFDRFPSVCDLLLRQHHLRGRIDQDTFQFFNGPLALDIEGTDRIHLIIPQFDTDRQFLGQRKYIDDSAPDRKLAHAIHLGYALVPQLYQFFLPLCDI